MGDKKQVIDFTGVGGYIRREKLEKLLKQKHGRKIEVTVRMPKADTLTEADRNSVQVLNDSFSFYAPEEPTEVSARWPC